MHYSFKSRLVILLSISISLLAGVACQTFDGPPQASLVEATDGILSDPAAPIVVAFSETVKADTLSLKVIAYDTTVEGALFDEDADDETELNVVFSHDGKTGEQIGGSGLLDEGRANYVIALDSPLAVGAKWAVIVEAGLADEQGNRWEVRQHLVFGYELQCAQGSGTDKFPSGTYFWLVQVDTPVPTQIQIWAAIEVDPVTGKFVGQFTNADRHPDLDCTPYDLACKSSEVCRLLPEPECVAPSERAGTVDEYPDWGFNGEAPTGYSFSVQGCVKEQDDGSVAFANAPADINVEQPPVDVTGASFNSSFSLDAEMVLRGSGTFTAEEVYIGGNPSGAGVGTHAERQVPDADRPEGLPPAPAQED